MRTMTNTLTLIEKYTMEKIDYLRDNKNEITPEILEELRLFGAAGKQIALDILELKDKEQLSPIHLTEIYNCKKDLMYFKDNYILILEKDKLQDNMLNFINSNKICKINTGSNTKKTYAACIYALHQFNFETKSTTGINSYNISEAKNILSNIANLYDRLPIWLKVNAKIQKTYMTSETNSRIITDATNENAYRGLVLNTLIIDTVNNVKPKILGDFFDNIAPSVYTRGTKVILLDTLYNINNEVFFDSSKEYIDSTLYPKIEAPAQVQKPELKGNSFKEIIKKIISRVFSFIKG